MDVEVRIELLANGATTLIMRGLNRQITNTSILTLLDEFPPHEGRRVYDFVYVPWATNASSNIGLAFVNFEEHQHCRIFLDSLHLPANQKKLLACGVRSVGQALIQGRGANLRAIIAKRGQAGLDDEDAPLVFHNGQPVPLQVVVDQEALPQQVLARFESHSQAAEPNPETRSCHLVHGMHFQQEPGRQQPCSGSTSLGAYVTNTGCTSSGHTNTGCVPQGIGACCSHAGVSGEGQCSPCRTFSTFVEPGGCTAHAAHAAHAAHTHAPGSWIVPSLPQCGQCARTAASLNPATAVSGRSPMTPPCGNFQSAATSSAVLQYSGPGLQAENRYFEPSSYHTMQPMSTCGQNIKGAGQGTAMPPRVAQAYFGKGWLTPSAGFAVRGRCPAVLQRFI
ncbi:unnamed protein product [Durusdinium trenchii]|uniref:RRM domain-containing protein n=1 Tax=Durusdinium trenchii TaxID=1381693 RepID=A0ABP0LCW8_9DINO